MRRGKLKSGDPFFGINVEHYVTIDSFATALADHFWTKSIEFDMATTKTEAKKILYNGLFHNGRKGVLSDGQLETADQIGEEYNNAYSAAISWVSRHYPYLSPNNNP